MKYIKLYEKYKRKYPKVGDFVVIHIDRDKMSTYIVNKLEDNNIHEIKNISYEYNKFHQKTIPWYTIKISGDNFDMEPNDIEYFSSNKQDCEMYLNTKKFNV